MILGEHVLGKESLMKNSITTSRLHKAGPDTRSKSRRNDIFSQGSVVGRKLGDFAIAFMGQNVVAINVGCSRHCHRVVQKICLLQEASIQFAGISSLKDDISRDVLESSDSATQYDIPFSRRVPVKSRK